MATETLTKDGVFDLRTPLLRQGLTTDFRARTDNLTVCIKVYADGGENLFHSHNAEDHAFVVLSGEATFSRIINGDEKITVLGKYSGIMLPKDMEYKFQSTGSGGNLVMLRIGARVPGETPIGKDLSFIPERIEIPGMFFPDDCP